MIRLQCPNTKCKKVFQLLKEDREWVLCPYCGTMVTNNTKNEHGTRSDASFVTHLEQIDDNEKKEQMALKEDEVVQYVQSVINSVKDACEAAAKRHSHFIEGIYSYPEDPAWANGPVAKSFVNMSKDEIVNHHLRDYRPPSPETEVNKKIALELIKKELSDLGFTDYEVEYISFEGAKMIGKQFWTGKPIMEKTGCIADILYIKVEW